MAWGKAGSTTLSSAGDAYELTITSSKFFQILDHTIPSGTTGQQINFNNDTTTSYAVRYSGNGAGDGTGVSRSGINHEWDQTRLDRFVVDYWSDISGEETLGISFSAYNDSTGAGTAPSRFEEVWKWDDTSQVSEIDMINPASGSFDTDSNLTVLGSDLTPTSAITFPTDVQVGSRAEITDTRKMYNYFVPSITHSDDFSSDAWTDTGSGVGVSGGQLGGTFSRGSTNHGSHYDLGAGNVSDTQWVCRFKLVITTMASATNTVAIGLSDNDTNGMNASRDGLGIGIGYDGGATYRVLYPNNTTWYSATATMTPTPASSTTRWIEMIRDSATSFTIKIYSDEYSTLVTNGTTTQAISGITGLRYIDLQAMNDGGSGGSTVLHIDDLEFYNDVTTGSNTWQEIGA